MINRQKIATLIEHATTYDTISGPYTERSLDEFKLAEIVAKECILAIQRKVIRNGNTPENLRSYEHVEDIAKMFGIDLPMDYFGIEYEQQRALRREC